MIAPWSRDKQQALEERCSTHSGDQHSESLGAPSVQGVLQPPGHHVKQETRHRPGEARPVQRNRVLLTTRNWNAWGTPSIAMCHNTLFNLILSILGRVQIDHVRRRRSRDNVAVVHVTSQTLGLTFIDIIGRRMTSLGFQRRFDWTLKVFHTDRCWHRPTAHLTSRQTTESAIKPTHLTSFPFPWDPKIAGFVLWNSYPILSVAIVTINERAVDEREEGQKEPTTDGHLKSTCQET
mmetsp:Transcript_64943/g.171864  ORF Transcript_64943/g.171864 Transcript_64943/m.171864 type:complete len:236 (-) Transcript_64943:1239-1946(-)